jgi:anaerobic magnesium-protoporphyrin IX monomethyl ester cyclase
MNIVLLYPPPWKISEDGDPPYPTGEGPPAGFDSDAALTGDFTQTPYGLLSLAAQLLKAGLRVSVFNLSNYPWREVERLIHRLDADLFGLSCLTANRRGMAMMVRFIRRVHPGARIVVGGPHVSALPIATLEHVPEIDVVVLGEGEHTFLEIVDRLLRAETIDDLPGTAWRSGTRCQIGPPLMPIKYLDTLASPTDYYDIGTLLTSRGCPMRCTFCSSRMMWGRRPRFHSVDFVLDMLEAAVHRHGRKIIAIKDDTFTADKDRALEICRQIRHRGLDFIWSCETRADCLDEELLWAMRMAGCKRISLGVETASEEILKNIRKQVLPDQVRDITLLIKRYGIQVRYYMMVGNRGETYETFQQSIDFINRCQPNQFVFSQLHLYPGTEEFDLFMANGIVSPEIFFQRDFLCLTVFAGKSEDEQKIRACLARMKGVQDCWHYRAEDYTEISTRLPEHANLYMDLFCACLREGNPEAAQHHLDRAAALGYALSGQIFNARACIAAANQDVETATAFLEAALNCYPHSDVIENRERLQVWKSRGGQLSGEPLVLTCEDHFETNRICCPPEHPDPFRGCGDMLPLDRACRTHLTASVRS